MPTGLASCLDGGDNDAIFVASCSMSSAQSAQSIRPARCSADANFLTGSTNLIIMLGMMQVSKRIPFEDPNVLTIVRVVYLASNVVIALIYVYIQAQINKKKGESDSWSHSVAANKDNEVTGSFVRGTLEQAL